MPLPDAIVRRSDVAAIGRKLRAYVARFPALALLLEDLPDDVDELDLPDVAAGRADLSTLGFAEAAPGVDEPPAIRLDLFGFVYASGDEADVFTPEAYLLDRLVDRGVVKLASGKRPPTRAERVAALEASQAVFRDRMTEAAAELARTGDVEAFEAALRQSIKEGAVEAAVAAKRGGWRAMSPADWGRVGQRVRNQYGFAGNFAANIRAATASGKPLTEGQIRARAHMYADATTASFAAQEAAEQGFDPSILGVYPGDGSTECYSRCRCRWVVRVLKKSRGDFDLRWAVSSSAESCRTCLKRRRVWAKVEVRGGRLVAPLDPAGYRSGRAR